MQQPMGLFAATNQAFKKYFTFSGRARRAEYWWFTLFLVLVSIVLSILDTYFALQVVDEACLSGQISGEGFFTRCGIAASGPLTSLFSLATLVPSLSIWSRRLHDTDRSFWWSLLIFIPIVGWIALFVFAVQRGTVGDNRFGPDPVTTP